MTKVVAVVAAKGGVGKSTVTANLAIALRQAGESVVVVDLDPQNALHLHLGGRPDDIGGLSRASVAGASWRDSFVQGTAGMFMLPFGRVNESDLRTLEHQISADQHWLWRNLAALGLTSNTIVLLDTPPGSSDYLRQALSVSNLAVSVMLADAASYATLPQIEGLIQRYCQGRPDYLGHACIINQVDVTRRLAKDAVLMIRAALGEHVIGVVHSDQSVSEALACGQTVMERDPNSMARAELMACSQWVQQRLHPGNAT